MNEIPWEQAINMRRSVRSFEQQELDASTRTQLKEFAESMVVPFEHSVQIRFFRADPKRRLYNTLTRAPVDGAAFIGETGVTAISAAGFVGEMFILYATSLGIATCWFGHYALSELERIMPHLDPNASPLPTWGYGRGEVRGERAICITPLGYWKREGVRLLDRMTERFMSHRRKPIRQLLEGGLTEDAISPSLLYALDLARKAPSAANSQHWRFSVSSDQRSITISMPTGYKHIKWEHPDVDTGICACHFWLGLRLQHIDASVELAEQKGRAVWHFRM